MKKPILLIILIFSNMTMLLNAQSEWGFSRFFHDENKTGYEVSVRPYSRLTLSWTTEDYSLPNEDAKTLIDILSTCNWEEYRETHTLFRITKDGFIIVESDDRSDDYGYYMLTCHITITHPDKRKVTLEINNSGVARERYSISHPNNERIRYLRLHNRSTSLSSDDIKRVKQLFFKNNIKLGNLGLQENVKIANKAFFSGVFHLDLPTISMDTTLSKQFMHLYNLGWDSRFRETHSLYHSHPIYVPQLFENTRIISTGNASLNLSNIDISEENRKILEDMIKNTLEGHDGEGEYINYKKIYYQYKNGLLHGQVKVYSLDGKLTEEFEYDNGLPALLITYTTKGIKEKEFHFIPSEMMVKWIEYDELERIKYSGKSPYQVHNYCYDDLRNLYKTCE